ncbi:MAG: hypothetical protein K2Y18_00520 [Alphaproteobacteria bacterium]|nr:hypothetical protein [Alphaproteobacteria bacterium]
MKKLNHILRIIMFIGFSIDCVDAAQDHDCDQCRGTIGASIHGSTGKWLNQEVPHRDWKCLEVEDLGSASKDCQMCEKETIRFVHRMAHEDYETLDVGCICAGHMDGDLKAAKERDQDLKSRLQRRNKWLALGWKTSSKGNPFLKTRTNKGDNKHHIVAITKSKYGQFSASIDKDFLNTWHKSMDEAKLAALDYIWPTKLEVED